MDAALSAVDTGVRLVLSLVVVLGVIALCWWAAYALLLQHVPIVRELLGRGRKQTRSEKHTRKKVVLLPGARLQPQSQQQRQRSRIAEPPAQDAAQGTAGQGPEAPPPQPAE